MRQFFHTYMLARLRPCCKIDPINQEAGALSNLQQETRLQDWKWLSFCYFIGPDRRGISSTALDVRQFLKKTVGLKFLNLLSKLGCRAKRTCHGKSSNSGGDPGN